MKKIMGVGTIYLALASIIISISNYLLHIFLARYLGVELYGLIGILMAFYMINTTFLTQGIVRTVSKLIAESKEKIFFIMDSSRKLMLIFSLMFTLFYLISSKLIAFWLGDLSLSLYILLVGLCMVPFVMLSLYWNGYLNGLRMFKQQAFISASNSILKTLFVFIFIIIGLELYGYILGILLAIITPLIIGKIFLKERLSQKDINWKVAYEKSKVRAITNKIISLSWPIVISSLFFTLIRNVNVLFVKSILSENYLAGLYTAATTLSNVPLMFFTSLSFTLMPSVSQALAANNILLVRKYILQSVRYLLLLLLPFCLVVAATSSSLISLFYSEEYSVAGSALSLLIFSNGLLSLFSVFAAVIVASGKPKIELFIGMISFSILVGLNLFLIPSGGIDGAALSLLLTSMITSGIAGVFVYKNYKVLIEKKSLLKISLASLFVFVISYLLPVKGWWLILEYLLLAIIYISFLFLLKEIKNEDIDLIKRVLGKKSFF
jgi:stage V sporulation protein B